MKRLFSLLALTASLSTGCAKDEPKELRIGVTAGPHAEIMEVVAAESLKRGVRLRVIEYADQAQPNTALADGNLDANSFQQQPYLEQQRKDRDYRIEIAANTVTFPAQSPAPNVIAVRVGDTERPEIKTLIDAYHSPEVRAFIDRKFNGAVVPAW